MDSPMKAVVTVKKNAETIPVKRKTSSFSSSVSTKKTTLPPESKSTVMSKQSKKHKMEYKACNDGSYDDFVPSSKISKKHRAED
ncbi:unnamed protein product [Ilex paraguariensis]|uniref:Uncharacterized protein n=1 Tax=Ilex paraguariensis TaxID=185542 RepID=A0ABC8UUN2_9AQUA